MSDAMFGIPLFDLFKDLAAVQNIIQNRRFLMTES